MATIDISLPRVTCAGTQYTVIDRAGTHTVTINNGCIGCTCGMDKWQVTCEHITLVEREQQVHVDRAARRAEYVEAFGIYA